MQLLWQLRFVTSHLGSANGDVQVNLGITRYDDLEEVSGASGYITISTPFITTSIRVRIPRCIIVCSFLSGRSPSAIIPAILACGPYTASTCSHLTSPPPISPLAMTSNTCAS